MSQRPLRGISVVVAGAGMAGLSAARALEADGATVTIVEARDRVGGRVWTIRDGFAGRQHAEAGGDLIESDHHATLNLARALKLETTPILDDGFGYYGRSAGGRLAIQTIGGMFRLMPRSFGDLVQAYKLAERRWDGPIAQRLASQSVADWLAREHGGREILERFRGMRGLMLADPEDLSLIAMVDLFADWEDPGDIESCRVRTGNDRLATETAKRLRGELLLDTVLRRVRQDNGKCTLTIERQGALSEMDAHYVIASLPASTLRDVVFEPSMPDLQRDAIANLRYGRVTRLLLQFDRRFWTKTGRPKAFGSDQPFGALWDGNEQQHSRAGILSFLAGGGASPELQQILSNEGTDGVVKRLTWLGTPAHVIGTRTITWENDPWARGGYAYFDPAFKSAWRDWLARPFGRVLFAGEHTSNRWQGYINGAIESGQRAAAEILSMQAISAIGTR